LKGFNLFVPKSERCADEATSTITYTEALAKILSDKVPGSFIRLLHLSSKCLVPFYVVFSWCRAWSFKIWNADWFFSGWHKRPMDH